MRDWTTSGRIKIERAKQHITDLQADIRAFHERHPYEIVGEDDVDTGDWVLKAEIMEVPPARWGAMAGDAIHNLRASLDILWRLLMYPSSSSDTDDRRTQFPIMQSAKLFKARFSRPIKGSRKAAVDLLKVVKPYKGGNDLLWLLHQLDIIDKHRGLIPAYSTVGTTIIDMSVGLRELTKDWGSPLPSVSMGLKWADPACPVEDGTELWRVRAALRGKVDMNPKFRFTIAFGEAEIVKAKPIIPTLHQLAQAVDGTVDPFLALL